MNFSIQKSSILDILTKIQGLTGRKSGLAITSSILIKAAPEGITITATDLESGYKGLCKAKVEKDGTIAINSRKIYEIVNAFPDDEIIVNEIENNWIEIGNDKVEYHLVGMNYDDFPHIPEIENVTFIEADAVTFKKMIEKTAYVVASADESRAHLAGSYFEIFENDKSPFIRMVSTDGNRLSLMDCPLAEGSLVKQSEGILVPKKGLIELSKFVPAKGSVKMGVKDNHFIVKNETETIIIRLLEGIFPKYNEIIELEDGATMVLNKQQFAMMLKRMSILASKDYKGVIFIFDEGKLLINSTNPNIGESKEDMEVDYTGQKIEVAFNPRYFIETLNVIEADKITLNIIDNEKPCKIRGQNDDTYLSVIMPMRI